MVILLRERESLLVWFNVSTRVIAISGSTSRIARRTAFIVAAGSPAERTRTFDRRVYLVRGIAVKAALLNVADHPDDRRGFGAAPSRDDLANSILFSPMPPRERQTHDSHTGAAFIIGVLKASSHQNRDAKGLEVLRRDNPHRGCVAWEPSASVKLLDPGSVDDGVRIQRKTGRHGGAQEFGL